MTEHIVDYWDATDYILALPDLERFKSGTGGQTMSLEAMKALLDRLGNPERGRKTVHVTGSKGKGSTSTFVASILHESGFKTALFTSPHLHDYVERLSFDMLPVSRFDFADGVKEIREAVDEVNQSDLGPISTFGVLVALYFQLCKKFEVEWQVVEVGLGGTHDATNVFESKDAAVITAISLEHTAVLGNTCAEIATEKSGIIAPGCVTVVGRQKDESVYPVIQKACQSIGSSLVDVRNYHLHPVAHDSNGQSFVVESELGSLKLHTAMLGMHQLENALTAVATAQALVARGEEISHWDIEDGIANAEITGRLEQLTRHPITIVDGAHNGESVAALVDALERHFDYEDAVVVLGTNFDKKLDEMMTEIARLQPKVVIATRSQSQRAMPAETIADAARKAGLECHITQRVSDAVDLAREFSGMDDLVCVTGSLYVVGEARQLILALPAMH